MMRHVLRFLGLHQCPWRRCTTVLSILLVVNTAFHWTLVDDVHSRSRQPGQRSSISMSNDGGGLPFRERVISINKWYDEMKGGKADGRGIDFDDVETKYGGKKEENHEDNLITYITRKPSNRRPLGELHLSTNRNVAESHLTRTKLQRVEEDAQENHRLVSDSLGSPRNGSDIVRKVEISRKEIESIRERVQTRRREIRNKSMAENVENKLAFLRKSAVRPRSTSAKNSNQTKDQVVKLIEMIKAATDCNVVEVYSNEKIRFYSQPRWLHASDIDDMNFLAGSWVLSRRFHRQLETPLSVNRLVLASNDEIERLVGNYERKEEKFDTEMECHQSQRTLVCQAAWCSIDLSLVVAFHLDRVIGLNVTPPTVGRELPLGTRPPPALQHVKQSNTTQGSNFVLDVDLPVRVVALIVTSSRKLHSGPAAERGAAEHDRFLTRKATERKLEVSPDLSEKLFIFCYILKISNCSTEIWTTYLNSLRPSYPSIFNESINGYCDTNISSPVSVFHLSMIPDRKDNILLKRFKRISPENMELLQAGRLRQRLLQSLFLDRVFWSEAGGRHGIEIILDIIDGRVKELFEWLSRFSNARKKKRKI
ncbi:Golgi-associated kinase 1B-like [Lytechinus pictus]|uniref:Golgi-associated kinase 1B-like n=1 Tax=Lytechinus pictus TaxID=7653 RepID=UPI0030B9C9C2